MFCFLRFQEQYTHNVKIYQALVELVVQQPDLTSLAWSRLFKTAFGGTSYLNKQSVQGRELLLQGFLCEMFTCTHSQ